MVLCFIVMLNVQTSAPMRSLALALSLFLLPSCISSFFTLNQFVHSYPKLNYCKEYLVFLFLTVEHYPLFLLYEALFFIPYKNASPFLVSFSDWSISQS